MELMSGCVCKNVNTEWSTSRSWYNDRVMDTYISAPIVDKQGDMIPTETIKEAMDFYMKYGIYAYKHDEIPIGQPLAYKIKDGKVLLKVGIHNKLDMHDKVWKEIQELGSKGASSIRGEAVNQNQECPPGESCFTKINKLGLWSVSWVGDSPANPEATVQTVSMAIEEEEKPKAKKIYVDKPSDAPEGADVKTGKRGGYYYYETKKSGENVSENELESNSHIKKCGECKKPIAKCGTCNKPVGKIQTDLRRRRRLEDNGKLVETMASMELDNIGNLHGKIKRLQNIISDMRKEHQEITKPPIDNEDAVEQQLLKSIFYNADEIRKDVKIAELNMEDLKDELSKLLMKMRGRRWNK